MKRTVILLFGFIAYGVFFATFLYLIAFVGNLQSTDLSQWLPALPTLIPRSIDFGGRDAPVALAIVINLGLILLFGLQHSVMARMGFKAWLKNKLPPSAERSVYVIMASLMLMLLFWQWRPIGQVVWSANSVAGQMIAWSVFAMGFAIVLLSTFLIDHFDLFGLKQVWRQFVGRSPEPPHFTTPLFYRLIRHPLYLGFILAFWSAPVMSAGHLLFAGAMTSYVLIAIQLEEKDLVRQLGDRYVVYRQQVPMLIPRPLRWFARRSDTASEVSTRPSV
jgi:protein-S-isoprenylcysteine O-methyltransferase Ste14